MMHPMAKVKIDAINTAPAAMSLVDFIKESCSLVTLSDKRSNAEFTSSNENTKPIQSKRIHHSIAVIPTYEPKKTTKADAAK